MRYLLLFFAFFHIVALEASDQIKPLNQEWSFEKLFGTFDRKSLQRGFQVYKEVCSACHSIGLLSYRNLQDLGFNKEEIKAIAAEYEVQDGPNDEGEMFMRPARPGDRFFRPYPNEKAARAANNGALPVDLSLVVKARAHGANYIYSLLTGYQDPPHGYSLTGDRYYNPYFPGKEISMPPPLKEGLVTFSDGTPATVEQMAHDITTFLAWAAEPHLEARKRMGIKALLFLLVFTGVMYIVKKRIWAHLNQ